MKHCQSIEKKLVAYLHGALNDLDRNKVDTHLAACAACRAELEAHRVTLSLLGEALELAPAPAALENLSPELLWVRPKTEKRPLFKKGLIGGRSTAVFVSAGAHLALFLIAGTFVVFTVIQQRSAQFVPPSSLERPQMKLKKLRVKAKQSSKPKPSVARINAKSEAVMADIQLPEMTGLGGGLSEGIGGFQMMMADINGMSLMGAETSIGNDLQGTFYDLKRLRSGAVNPDYPTQSPNHDKITALVERYIENDWSTSTFAEFYRAPKRLYATQFMVPPITSNEAPAKFGITDPDFVANSWVVVYSGKIAHPEGGRFRFWGLADDLMVVGINKEWVLDASWGTDGERLQGLRYKKPDEHRKYALGNKLARVGKWFTLEPDEPVQMDLLVSEIPGGTFCMMLLVEQEGVEYPENEYGAPILPMFKTMVPATHLVDEILYQTVPDRFEMKGGPVFGVY